MTDFELKKLRRTDLLELLLAQEQENESLRAQLQEAQALLKDRKILLAESGNIADATLQLNRVFHAAQAAADQYLENIRHLCTEKELTLAQLEKAAVANANKRLREAEALCSRMEAESRAKADQILKDAELQRKALMAEAERDLKAYWARFPVRKEDLQLYTKPSGEAAQAPDTAKGNTSE